MVGPSRRRYICHGLIVAATPDFLGLGQNGVCWALRAGSQRFGRAEDRQTRYRDPLAVWLFGAPTDCRGPMRYLYPFRRFQVAYHLGSRKS